MKDRAWVASVLLSTFLVASAVVGVNYAEDVFGVYRDPTGRHLGVHVNGRTTKYLFSLRYVPTNFTGLLLGSSITENWDTARIHGANVYNASFSGANVSEQALLARNVFDRKHMQLTIITVFPYMTASHGRKTTYMAPEEYWSGLGSLALLGYYANRALELRSLRQPEADSNGVGLHPPTFVSRKPGDPPMREPETIDSQGFADFVSIVKEAHLHSDRVVALIPPYPNTVWLAQRAFLEAYRAHALAAFRPGDTVVDFNQPRYEGFRADASHFPDGAHIASDAARFLVDELDEALRTSELNAADYARRD